MTRGDAARLGGLARARALSAARRSEIARMGWLAMVKQHFGGDASAATRWLTAKGLAALDPFPNNGAWPDPGPFPQSTHEGIDQ